MFMLSTPSSLFGTATGMLEYDLQQARQRLQENIALSERIAADIQTLRGTDDADPQTVTAYEAYLERVEAMVTEDRKTIAQLEDLNARYNDSAISGPINSGSDDRQRGISSIPEEQFEDGVTALDRELESSLAAFDAFLLKELELIRTKSEERMRDLSAEAAEAVRRLKEKGIDLESEAATDSIDASENTQTPDQSETSGETAERSESSRDIGAVEKRDGRSVSQPMPSGVEGVSGGEDERNAGRDDDIVARQLREAAEKETDPELKAKLWEEYEAYKKNRRRNN